MSMEITGSYNNYGVNYMAAANRKQETEAGRTDTEGKTPSRDKTADYYSSLQKNYECVRNGKVSISGSYLKECAKDPEKAKNLENDLSLYKELSGSGRKNAEANARALGAKLVSYEETWSYDRKGNLTMMAQSTVVSGDPAKEAAQKKAAEEEKAKKKQEKKHAEGKSQERIEEKRKEQKEQEEKIMSMNVTNSHAGAAQAYNSYVIEKDALSAMKTKMEEIKRESKVAAYSKEAEVTLSNEGMQRYHDSILENAKGELNNAGIILTDYDSVLGGRLPSSYGEKNEKGEYDRIYYTVSDQANSLLSAYAELYDEIQKGYEAGTRETYVEDKTSETGYKKLTKEEEIAELDKAFQSQVKKFERRNNKAVLDSLIAHKKKILDVSSGRTKIAEEAVGELERKKEELDKLPYNFGKNL